MNYTNDLKAAVKHLTQNYVLPELHPAIVAQLILESERGHSKLAREFRNFAGMKWRKELEGIGKSRLIDVDSDFDFDPKDFSNDGFCCGYVNGFGDNYGYGFGLAYGKGSGAASGYGYGLIPAHGSGDGEGYGYGDGFWDD